MTWELDTCNIPEFQIDEEECNQQGVAQIRAEREFYTLCQKHFEMLKENKQWEMRFSRPIKDKTYNVKKRRWTTNFVKQHIGHGEQATCSTCETEIPENLKRFKVGEVPHYDNIEQPICLACMEAGSENMHYTEDVLPEEDTRKMRNKVIIETL